MKMKLFVVSCILIHFAIASQEWKRVPLCQGLNPGNPSNLVKEDLKDVLTEFAKKRELQLHKDFEDKQAFFNRYPYYSDHTAKPVASEKIPVGSKTPVLGSSDHVINPGHDAGLLSTVLEAYNRHYVLRTGPEDWWYTIVQIVAVAIDNNSNKTEVRDFFVQHEGKKRLTVSVEQWSIYDVDYSWFFDQMSKEIAKNINVPEYVDKMQTDFSGSTAVHKIVSQVVLMKSLQEYFEYTMSLACGIPAIEMKGTQEDWQRLVTKIGDLRDVLRPIENHIGLTEWWGKAEEIANNLLDTYNDNPDKEWWSTIIEERNFGSGPPEFKGWFMVNLLNTPDAEGIGSAPSGLVSVAMTVTNGFTEEQSAVIAGMVGYKLHGSSYFNETIPPVVEPVHGWSLLMEPESGFRNDLEAWEEKINGIES